ncbi:hypothetical protein BTJ39_23165 [Izhakiella australiensis]|uniref:DUF2116 family Zn-ribbon domain-containing protein n=1 Tax=Izhakiella australiensis TaxID=1926881 RepID=A0A1S8Y7H4_9GAMM|nr:hypothetical protein [Izhakiella australiensis]OON34767.1 hypothetical protein BTJ39_23165 [Izhakiella australiensis]
MNFADPIDEAVARQQQTIEIALANRTRTPLIYTGECHWCRETISTGAYCDSDCRDDHQQYLRAQSQRVM